VVRIPVFRNQPGQVRLVESREVSSAGSNSSERIDAQDDAILPVDRNQGEVQGSRVVRAIERHWMPLETATPRLHVGG
jgi:hypothetical protein